MLPIAALQDLNEDKKKKEREEMFNSLVKKNQPVPKEDEISNWVLAGKNHALLLVELITTG